MFSDASEAGIFFDDALDGARGDATIIARCIGVASILGVVKEKRGKGIVTSIEIILHAIGGGAADENWTVFTALTAHHELTTF